MRRISSAQIVTPAKAGVQQVRAERELEEPGFRLPPE